MMKMKFFPLGTGAFAFLLGLCVLASTALGAPANLQGAPANFQEAPAGAGGQGGYGGGNLSGNGGRMEQVRQRIQTLKMWKLTKALDLDENTASRLFPVMNGYDRQRAALMYDRRRSMEDLRAALKRGDEKRMGEVIKELESLNHRLERLNDEERAKLGTILTVRQQAKLILFMPGFNRQIKRMIEMARQGNYGRR